MLDLTMPANENKLSPRLWLAVLNFICVICLGMVSPIARATITLTFFPNSTYSANTSAMNMTLGLSGYTIDDFSSTNLIPGLTITLSGNVSTTTFSALPGLFNQNTSGCGAPQGQLFSWTEQYAVTNTVTNSIANCQVSGGFAQITTFNYASGASSIGIGLANFQSYLTNHALIINGVVQPQTLETLAGSNWTSGYVLTTYLRIDATNGSSITSVGIENLAGQDFIGFSDFAVLPIQSTSGQPSGDVPMPTWALALLAAGLLGAFVKGKKWIQPLRIGQGN